MFAGVVRGVRRSLLRFDMKVAKDKKNKRYCTVEESLIQSFKEMKLMRAGLMPQKPWEQTKAEVEEYIEKVRNGEEV